MSTCVHVPAYAVNDTVCTRTVKHETDRMNGCGIYEGWEKYTRCSFDKLDGGTPSVGRLCWKEVWS